MLLFLFFYIWLRATLPRFRYDQLMGIAWKVLLPLVLINILFTALIRLRGNDQIITGQLVVVVAVVRLPGVDLGLNQLSNRWADTRTCLAMIETDVSPAAERTDALGLVAFYLLAAICVLCAGGVVARTIRSTAAIFLVISFFNVAGIFVMLGAEFLAVVQVIVYTGAILVLVLFVLMLVDPDDLPEFHRPGRFSATSVSLLGAGAVAGGRASAILGRTVMGVSEQRHAREHRGWSAATPRRWAAPSTPVPAAVRVASLVLTVGVIGAIVLAMPERLGERESPPRHDLARSPARARPALPSGAAAKSQIPGSRQERRRRQPIGRELIMVGDPDDYTTVGTQAIARVERAEHGMTDIGTDHFLFLSAALFIIGMMGVLIRRNMLIIFMCVELMVTAANISFVAFGWETNSLSGQTFAIFTIAVAAAEAAVGLAIIMALSRRSKAESTSTRCGRFVISDQPAHGSDGAIVRR